MSWIPGVTLAIVLLTTTVGAGEFDSIVVKPVAPSQPAKAAPPAPPMVKKPVRRTVKPVVRRGADSTALARATELLATAAPAPALATVAPKVVEGEPTPLASVSPAALRDTLIAQLASAPPAVSAGPALAGFDASAPPRAVAAAAAATLTAMTWEGQLRYRYEARSVLDYRVPGTFKRISSQSLRDAGDVSIMRTRLGADVRFSPGVKGYFNIQDARTMGAEGSPGGTLSNVDLFLAYVDLDSIGGKPLSVRSGRQVLSYGDARLVSGADWGNAGRGYDGTRVRFAPKDWQLDVFVAWINEGRLEGEDRLFSGADVLWRVMPGLELEGYQFMRSFGDTGFVAEDGRKGGLYDGTTGGRVRYLRGHVETKVEGAIQRGHRAGDEAKGWFGAGRVTLELPGDWKPRAMLEHMLASGDQDPTDGLNQRFDPIYWGGHSYQGALDIAGASNLRDWCGGLTLQPRKSWTLQSEYHRFTLLQAKDAWVDDAGTTLRRDLDGSSGTELGSEFDVTVRWEARPRVTVFAGWSRFWAGGFVRDTGGGGDLDWGFLQMAVGF